MKKIHLAHLLTLTAGLSTNIVNAQEPAPSPGAPPDAEHAPADRPRRDGDRLERRRTFAGPPEAGRGERPSEDRLMRAPAPLPSKPQPFLGVVTGPLDPALNAQLGLTEGLGLVVEDVLPDSPAAKAGVLDHDVLKQLNDQFLSNPNQLAALVRHFGKDAEVTLTIVRKGAEQKLAVTIGEHLAPDRRPLRGTLRYEIPNFDDAPKQEREPREGPQPRLERLPNKRFEPLTPRPGAPSADILREVGPSGAPEVKITGDQVQTTWNTASAKVVLKDEAGEIEVRSENGKRTLIAKNPQGETVFDGPIDTEKQRDAIPPAYRKKLEQVEARTRVDRPQLSPGPRPRREGDQERGGSPRDPTQPPSAERGIQ